MRYGVVILCCVTGACNHPFSLAEPTVWFVSASLSDTVVSAGSQFVASARVGYTHCRAATINVLYGGAMVSQEGERFEAAFTAVNGDTLVYFGAFCGLVGSTNAPILTLHVASAR